MILNIGSCHYGKLYPITMDALCKNKCEDTKGTISSNEKFKGQKIQWLTKKTNDIKTYNDLQDSINIEQSKLQNKEFMLQ